MDSKAAPHPNIKDLAQRAVGPLRQVWGVIASDVVQCNEECGEGPLTTAIIVETCTDANYLSTNFPEYKDLEDEIYGLNAADSTALDRELVRIW